MRFAISTVAGIALAACVFLGSARAEVFNFSYTFSDGGVASGVVEGIVQSDPNVVFLDSIDSLVALGETIVSPSITTVSGIPPVVVTFDGSGNMDFTAPDPSSTLGFQVSSSSAVAAAFASSAADIEVTMSANAKLRTRNTRRDAALGVTELFLLFFGGKILTHET